ncbi:MAG: hypothetical protein R3F59_16770 [Myxococcota bacterium]
MTYDRWLDATQRVLRALDVWAEPVVAPQDGRTAGLAVFQNQQSAPKLTFERPTARLRAMQLDPGVNGISAYEVEAYSGGSWSTVGCAIAVGSTAKTVSGRTWTADSEYWDVDKSSLNGNPMRLTLQGSTPPSGLPKRSDQWRVDVASSETVFVASGSLPTSASWKLATATLPAFHIDGSAGHTDWIRTAVADVGGTTLWDAITSTPYAYTNALRTRDVHLAYST